MKYVLKEMSNLEKPREKLVKRGPQALNDYELLAIVFRTGTKEKSALDLAIEVTSSFASLQALKEATFEELVKIKGIGMTKAVSLLATVELGKRINSFHDRMTKIKSAHDAFLYVRDLFSRLHQEMLIAIYLNAQNEVICYKEIGIGVSNKTLFDAKDVMRWAIKAGAYAIVLAHNHPSGNCLPSEEDKIATELFIKACATLNFVLADHLIVGKNQYYSMTAHTLFRTGDIGESDAD